MFLGLTEAMTEITAAITSGLGPIYLVNNPKELLSSLPGTLVDLVIQICATFILFIAVLVFFWKPITKILEARREAIDKELIEAEAAKANAILVEDELRKTLDEAKEKVKEMLDQAVKDANVKKEEIIASAKEEAKRRLENLEFELEQEKKNMESSIKKEIVDIAFAAAEKIVQKEIDQKKYLDVVDDILKGGN
ncbi:MAG: F0F1 ATP synthase subunit B [Acholeplasmatales bacterium]|nr:F0F1 ATP synthase subunit B [Acholeplasmatales bacterium]